MKNNALQKELKDLLQDRFVTSDSVLNNFSKGEDAYDPVKPQIVYYDSFKRGATCKKTAMWHDCENLPKN